MRNQSYRISCKVLRLLLGRHVADQVKKYPIGISLLNLKRSSGRYWAISVYLGDSLSHYELIPASWLATDGITRNYVCLSCTHILANRNDLPQSLIRWLRVNKDGCYVV